MKPLDELKRIVKPPVAPLCSDPTTLRDSERHLNIVFPADYVELCATYGTGCFGDRTFYFWIENVLSIGYSRCIDDSLETYRWCQEDFPEMYPLPVYPEARGFLPCGADVDSGKFGYVVTGAPDEWKVATRSRDCSGFEIWDMSLTQFLRDALCKTTRPKMWRSDFPETPESVTFVPGPDYHRSVLHRPKPT